MMKYVIIKKKIKSGRKLGHSSLILCIVQYCNEICRFIQMREEGIMYCLYKIDGFPIKNV